MIRLDVICGHSVCPWLGGAVIKVSRVHSRGYVGVVAPCVGVSGSNANRPFTTTPQFLC